VERARSLRNESQTSNHESEALYATISPALLNGPMVERPIMAYDRSGNTAMAEQVADYVQVIESGTSRRRRREAGEEPEGQYGYQFSNLRLEVTSGTNAGDRTDPMYTPIDPALSDGIYGLNPRPLTQTMGPPSVFSRKKKKTVVSVNEADETASLVSACSDRTCPACRRVFKFPRDLRFVISLTCTGTNAH
jgi:hypothetical protein